VRAEVAEAFGNGGSAATAMATAKSARPRPMRWRWLSLRAWPVSRDRGRTNARSYTAIQAVSVRMLKTPKEAAGISNRPTCRSIVLVCSTGNIFCPMITPGMIPVDQIGNTRTTAFAFSTCCTVHSLHGSHGAQSGVSSLLPWFASTHARFRYRIIFVGVRALDPGLL
jgi:hypothetical protein